MVEIASRSEQMIQLPLEGVDASLLAAPLRFAVSRPLYLMGRSRKPYGPFSGEAIVEARAREIRLVNWSERLEEPKPMVERFRLL
jgi:hypothetical protein